MGLAHSPSIVTDGLALYLDAANAKSYPGTGTVWGDLSGNGNNGSLLGGVGYSQNEGGSLVFDGVDDKVLITCNSSTVRTFNSTTQFVVKLPVYSGSQRCILSYRTEAGRLYIGKINSGIYCYYDQLSSPILISGNISNNSLIVCHVLCDATNNLFSIYLNGLLVGSDSRTGWVSSYHSNFYLGWDAGGTNEYMLGNLYQFSHYDRVLSPSEISQNYSALRGRFGV
jgi:hypothetical protein